MENKIKETKETNSINVFIRCRPINDKEKKISFDSCVSFPNYNSITLKSNSENNSYTFSFDKVFQPSTRQEEIFINIAKPIVDSLFDGFNGTILAYGQTSSGKTFTMQGVNDHTELEGVIPRIIRNIYEKIERNKKEDFSYIVKISMVELYNEKFKDLTDVNKNNLQVREDKVKGIYIEDLTEHVVDDSNSVFQLMNRGNKNRSVNATNMNEASSRSHSIFIINVIQNNLVDLSAKIGKLFLVDLAGSEKISKTGASGATLGEAKYINKSLTTLGLVINNLTDGKSNHIPYRDSKLTRILQESLGGNSKTSLIATLSTSVFNEAETLSTLRFASRAKKIKNSAKMNKEYSISELKCEVNKLEGEVGKFRSRVSILEEYLIKNGLPLPDNLNESICMIKNDNNIIKNVSNNNCISTNEFSEKYIEILDIINDLEDEKLDLNYKLKSAFDRVESIKVRHDQKELLVNELMNIKKESETKAEEMSKEYKKMQELIEKKNDRENSIDLNNSLIIRKNIYSEKKNILELKKEVDLEIINENILELNEKTISNPNSIMNENNINLNISSKNNTINKPSKDYSDKKEEIIDELLIKLESYTHKCPDIDDVIVEYKRKLSKNYNHSHKCSQSEISQSIENKVTHHRSRTPNQILQEIEQKTNKIINKLNTNIPDKNFKSWNITNFKTKFRNLKIN